MEAYHSEERCCNLCEADRGAAPFVANVSRMARQNQNFRTALWTGHQAQMTLMSIPACGEIGAEVHSDTDQIIRVEEGQALVRMGTRCECMDTQCRLAVGDVVFIPCGTWHNIINTGSCALKLSSIYAPPHHPAGTVHRTKADAEHG